MFILLLQNNLIKTLFLLGEAEMKVLTDEKTGTPPHTHTLNQYPNTHN
jgi:hypothetical protein